jgi:branched-chain amino acid aminotransferase
MTALFECSDTTLEISMDALMDVEIAIEKTQAPKPHPSEENLGFGRYFSDHMFIADFSESVGWHAPRIVPYQPLRIDPGASVLHYGQAIFEGLKAFKGVDGKVRLFRPEMNHKRMQASADRLCMRFLDYDVYLEGLKQLVRIDIDWVPSRPGTALYLRPTLIGSEAFLGVRPAENFIYYVIASPVGSYYGDNIEAVKIWVEREYSRAAAGGIGAAKAGGNYASSLIAATAAKKRGFSQVLWLDASEKRYVEEVGTMNVFFRIGDKILTPPLGGTILPGVTRASVIELMARRGTPVVERRIELTEIVEAHRKGELKEIFGSGTAASISPVGALGLGDELLTINGGKPGEVSTELHKTLNDIQYGRTKDTMGWTVEV